ncbi:MAG: mechanosensitive ion channel [Sedimentisphaerales bacterium]|nr:mechanosensitive ion channel [Sedimentisphaerales bacterium]
MQITGTIFQKKPVKVRLTILLAISIVTAFCFSADAQDTPVPESSLTTEPGFSLPTSEEIENLIKQFKDTRDQQTGDEQKKPFDNLIDIYEKAKAKLIEIQKFETATTDLQNARKQAPERLAAVQAQLEQFAAEPKIEENFTDWPLTQIEQHVTQKEADLTKAKNNVSDLDSETKQRSARRTEIPPATVQAKQSLENTQKELAIKPASDVPPELVKAKRILLLLTEKSLQREIESYTEEILSYDARGNLLAARKDLAVRQVTQCEKLLKQWQDILNKRRKSEAEQTAEKARQAKRQAAQSHPIIRKLAEENTQLAELRTGPRGLIATNARQSDEIKSIDKKLTDLSSEFDRVKDKVKTAGFSDVIGVILLGKRNELPDIRQLRRNIKSRRSETANAYFMWIKYDEQRSELDDTDSSTDAILKEVETSLHDDQRLELTTEVKILLETRRELLDALIREYDNYRRNLESLDFTERQLVAKVTEYANYIDENILWVKNTKSLNLSTLPLAGKTLIWLTAPRGWWHLLRAIALDAKAIPLGYAFVTLLFAILCYLRKKLRKKMEKISTVLYKKYTDRFAHTLKVFLFTVILASTVPIVLLFLGWRLALPYPDSDFVNAAAAGLRAIALIYLFLAFLRLFLLPHGLAADHFRMPDEAIFFLRRQLTWFMASILPLIFVIATIDQQAINARKESLARIAFIAALVILSIFFAFVIRPAGPLMKPVLVQHRGGWLDRLRFFWFPLSVIFPLALALFAALGYYYAAQQLAACLQANIMWILCLVIIFALMVRWLTVTENKLLLKKERQLLETVSRQETNNVDQENKTETDISKPHDDFNQISLQMRRFINVFFVLSLIVGIWVIWKNVLPALGIFNQVKLWTTTVGDITVPVTLASLLLALIIIVITVITARNIPGLLELVILQRLPFERGVRFAIVTLARYVIIIVGFVMAFTEIGIGWSKVQWLVAAMTVGLGFGLQEIFANFISGLIILFEQPMRVGDTVTVGDISGEVIRIKIRATTIRRWDRKELIVPNREFVTGQLINWTLSDNVLRLEFPVGIAYGSNIELTEEILKNIAKENEKVLQSPKPKVVFKGFGNNALEFELRLFISDIDDYLVVWHNVNCQIDKAFRNAGIEIAFPQRDIHIRSIKSSLPIQMNNPEQNQDK